MSTGRSPKPVCLADIEKEAKNHLSGELISYYQGGADEEQTRDDNIDAFKRLRLRPRMLRGISEVDMSTTLLGQTVSMPICVAPTGYHKFAHPDGERATAKAVTAANTCMVLSIASNTRIEDVALAAPRGLRWLQFFILKDREQSKTLIRTAEQTGYEALVLTVDTSVLGKKRAYEKSGLKKSFEGTAVLFGEKYRKKYVLPRYSWERNVSWDIISWIKSITKLPLILKGILTAEDAKLAVQHGADAIIVSNHGGRQLDGVLAGIDALPEVVSAVNGQIEVYMDGGVRLGTDVLKALSLGARAVFIGRPVVWGLAYQGEEGVLKVLEILREEFRTAMILSGCSRLSDISPSLVTRMCKCNL